MKIENKIRDILTGQFGLEILVDESNSPEGKLLSIIPSNLPKTKGFKIDFIMGWRSFTGKFTLANYANELIEKMRTADEIKKSAFCSLTGLLISKNVHVDLIINGSSCDPSISATWESDWNSFELTMRKLVYLNQSGNQINYDSLIPLIANFYTLSICLLPLKKEYSDGAIEGDSYQSFIKRYERSAINRTLCIENHGTSCKVCGIKFENIYGPLGEGFIHVHHIIPVSTMVKPEKLDPSKDLIPVCPNCHAMLHKTEPPKSIDELKEIIYGQQRDKN